MDVLLPRRISRVVTAVAALTVVARTAAAAPDLTPTALGAPASANAAQTIGVSWTVQNQGTTTAAAPWRDRIWFSTDAVLGGDTLLLFDDKGSGFTLASGASYTGGPMNVTIPNVAEGAYYLIVETDSNGNVAESDETNNTFATAITVTKPDVTPTSVTVPASANSGQSFTVSWTILNQGTGGVTNGYRDRIFFSTDTTIGGGDTDLGFFDFSGTQASGANRNVSTGVNPPAVAEGVYYIIVRTDDASQIPESDETNNTFATAITITKPDVTPTALTPPASANSGQSFTVSWTILNQGTGGVTNGYRDRLFFSTDTTIGGGDTDLGFFDFSGTQASGASRNVSTGVNPPTVAEGTYYIIVRTDDASQIPESDETNNTLATAILITKPDLTPTALNVPAIIGAPFQSVSISWTIQNAGTGPVLAGWRDRFFLSTDAVLGGGDVDMSFTDSGGTLASGASRNVSGSINTPNVAAGNYYVIIQTDNANQSAESDETNNTLAVPVYVTTCGDGITGGSEGCDLGGANGASTSCCTASCQLRSAGQTCRPTAGTCDVAETCTGSTPTCPTDGFVASTTVCRASAGVCDVAESCTGSTPTCPTDGFVASTTVCRASAGACDVADSCTGTSATCPVDGFASTATVCRPSAGTCDVAESCDGTSAACPADTFQASTTVCRPAAAVCDVAESCTGSTAACPANQLAPTATVCRASAGPCDVAEACDGSTAVCPGDAFQPSTLVCRAAAGVCDVAENCTGAAAACPADTKSGSATTCRAAVNDCDVAETCDGVSDACPADALAADGTGCDDGDACTSGETCTAGACGDGTVVTCNPCEVCDTVGGCQIAPQTGCKRPTLAAKAQLFLQDRSPDAGDQVKWKWGNGEATDFPEFGAPITTDDYTFCVYDGTSNLLFKMTAPAGGTCGTKPCWKQLGSVTAPKGYKYKDVDGLPNDLDQLQLKAGAQGKAKMSLKGKGDNIPMPALGNALALPIRTQVQRKNGGCWEATFSPNGISTNTSALFKAKSDAP